MQDHQNTKRGYLAWILLLVLCLQRIVGHVGNEVVYAIAVDTYMDTREKAIADKVESETGNAAHIEIQDDKRIAYLQTLGYVTPFIFSEEINEEITHYTVEEAPMTSVTYVYEDTDHPDPQEMPNNRNFKERLFSSFCFQLSPIHLHTYTTINTQGTTVPLFSDASFIAIPSPPPKWV